MIFIVFQNIKIFIYIRDTSRGRMLQTDCCAVAVLQ